MGRVNTAFGLMREYGDADVTSPKCPWESPPRLDGTDFLFAQTSFCIYIRVPYMRVLGTGVSIGCCK